jgi:hypothetical protein
MIAANSLLDSNGKQTLDARMPPLVLKAYSYVGSQGEALRAVPPYWAPCPA